MEPEVMIELSQEFASLGAELVGDGDAGEALRRMTQLAVKHVEGCASASITLVRNARGSTVAASDEVAERADMLQYSLGEGPCLSAAVDGEDYWLFDVHAELRWPRYAQALLHETSVRSVLAFRLVTDRDAALNLYAHEAGAFGDDALAAATVLAAHLSTLVALHDAATETAHLRTALRSSRQIGAAVGILMAHHKIDEAKAFTLLSAASQQWNRKLRDVALDVIDTGEIAEVAPARGDRASSR